MSTFITFQWCFVCTFSGTIHSYSFCYDLFIIFLSRLVRNLLVLIIRTFSITIHLHPFDQDTITPFRSQCIHTFLVTSPSRLFGRNLFALLWSLHINILSIIIHLHLFSHGIFCTPWIMSWCVSWIIIHLYLFIDDTFA